jgi:hypothetical protein
MMNGVAGRRLRSEGEVVGMNAKRPLVMPLWAWIIVVLIWLETEFESELRSLYYRFKARLA